MVTNSGEFDGTEVHYYETGWRLCQVNNGSGDMVRQFIHGTQYIDEVVMMRAAGKGDLYVHQDANWNVIATTDLGGSVVERNTYTPYGEVSVDQVTSWGDRDGDSDVDATDKGTVGVTCTGTVSGACRILDLDFDGDYDSTDGGLFDYLAQGLARHPGRSSSGVGQGLGHQGMLHDWADGSWQSRARQYCASLGRFIQRDPLTEFANLAIPFNVELNSYSYVRQGPANKLDPSGLSPALCVCDCGLCPLTSNAQSEGIRIAEYWCRVNNACLPGDFTDPDHRAVRHCVGSALLAIQCGCQCSFCIGLERENEQTQSARERQRAINNNLAGLNSAGCRSTENWEDLSVPYPIMPRKRPSEAEAAVSCVRKKQEGSLDDQP